MTDVVVAGGGAIGLSIAWRAARRGMSVTVVDPAPGRGATWAAAGLLAPVTELHPGEERLLELNLASAARYESFVAELAADADRDVGFRRSGTLVVARDADDNAALEDLYRLQVELGMDVERLRGRDCRALEPALAPRVRGGILVPGDHQVDNRALAGALLDACVRAGVDVRRERVDALETSGGRAAGVRTPDGGVEAGAVVLAAGAWSGAVAGVPAGALPPVRPVKGQLLQLRDVSGTPLAARNLRGVECYVVPRADGRVVVGATVEERGFDDAVTAGAVFELLRAAYELVPGVTELELVETVAGLRPATPDNGPAVGATEVAGLVVATGHFRNGVLQAPITAEAVCALLAGDEPPGEIAPFSPARFAPAEAAR
ncbi:MAG TPA: glycine oxidase ThiO [Actinomycetota bacterium]|nr:glycine oxidase ThiO [Actinomycetota bacterium]